MSDQEDIAAIAEAAGLGPRLHGVPLRYSGSSISPIDLKTAEMVCKMMAGQIPSPAGYVLSSFIRGAGLRIGVFGKA